MCGGGDAPCGIGFSSGQVMELLAKDIALISLVRDEIREEDCSSSLNFLLMRAFLQDRLEHRQLA